MRQRSKIFFFLSKTKAVVFIFSFLFYIPSFSQTPANNIFENVKNNTYLLGEKLTFRISYSGWLNVGECIFEVKPESVNISEYKQYHIVGTGRSFSWYDWFFKVRDTYQSYIEKETLLPTSFTRDIYEGGTKFYESITFNRKEKKAVSNRKSYDIPPDVHDVLSAMYYFRCLDFSKCVPNQMLPVKVSLDDAVYDLNIQYVGKGTISTRLGTFKCLIFRPQLIPGTIFKSGAKMDLWVSDDENKIPLKVKAEILIGSIITELYETSGLKYPLSSKIK